ncbi:MAG: YtxH domain-containing protein [Acidobacteria bacterium]|nr:YtxH domain-containing protein [Acidobacteriota bacterium]
MARDNGTGAGGVMLAFVVGVLTGAAVALLFAPTSGEETREYLGKKAREGRDRARDLADEGKEFLDEQAEAVNRAVDEGVEAFRRVRQRGERA